MRLSERWSKAVIATGATFFFVVWRACAALDQEKEDFQTELREERERAVLNELDELKRRVRKLERAADEDGFPGPVS